MADGGDSSDLDVDEVLDEYFEAKKELGAKLEQIGLARYEKAINKHAIASWDSLEKMSDAELHELARKVEMSSSDLGRLFKFLGRNPKESTAKLQTDAPKQNAVKKSSYYHFESTPTDMARKFDATEVQDPSKAKFQRVKGGSSWNPGNTVENRDYSDHAQKKLKEELLQFELASGIRIVEVSKTTGDLTVICSRGKIKCVYDLGFEVKWEGNMGVEDVKGELKVSDIITDDDDWYIEHKGSKPAIKLISENLIERLNVAIFKPMLKHYLNSIC